jgi:hypothetical protein
MKNVHLPWPPRGSIYVLKMSRPPQLGPQNILTWRMTTATVVVAIHAIATFQAFKDYLCPQIIKAQDDKRLGRLSGFSTSSCRSSPFSLLSPDHLDLLGGQLFPAQLPLRSGSLKPFWEWYFLSDDYPRLKPSPPLLPSFPSCSPFVKIYPRPAPRLRAVLAFRWEETVPLASHSGSIALPSQCCWFAYYHLAYPNQQQTPRPFVLPLSIGLIIAKLGQTITATYRSQCPPTVQRAWKNWDLMGSEQTHMRLPPTPPGWAPGQSSTTQKAQPHKPPRPKAKPPGRFATTPWPNSSVSPQPIINQWATSCCQCKQRRSGELRHKQLARCWIVEGW